jgi:hypothetical protein
MKNPSIDRIQQGFFDLIIETKTSNETLIQRAKILDAVAILIKDIKLHTRRRLSNKLSANPDKTVNKIFDKFREAVEVIK